MDKNLSYLLVGWFLGLLSPLIISLFQRRKNKNEVEKCLFSELDETRYKFVCLLYSLTGTRGQWNHEFFEWINPYYDSYQGIYQDKRMLKSLNEHLKLTEEQISFLNKNNTDSPNKSKSLKKYYLSFLESNINYISLFSVNIQRQLLDLRSQMLVFNDLVDESQKYHFMTFDSSLSDENQNIVKINIEGLFDSVIKRSKYIIESIDGLISKFE
ncbi:hypothetical protein H8E88_00505 [candidate division KSB1 bacterium]|nr:hypothetical protein [candidate division KSB1 bacterium]